jgi:hypothetical protein
VLDDYYPSVRIPQRPLSQAERRLCLAAARR